MRRTMLFIPGNNPGMLQSGGVFGADSLILDLEDAVSPREKDAARLLVAQALRTVDFRGSLPFVRINPLNAGGASDIGTIVPCKPYGLMLPKIESPEDLLTQLVMIEEAEIAGQEPVQIIPLLETPLGVARALEIATASPRIIALAFGAEDYTAALGASRTLEGKEILTARSLIANAAAAVQIDSIDTPFTDAQDDLGLQQDTLTAKSMGFKGKLAINPRQIDIIHQAFCPSSKEIEWACRVVHALEEAKNLGSGVIAVDGKMVDAPVVLRAERVITLAKQQNLIQEVES